MGQLRSNTKVKKVKKEDLQFCSRVADLVAGADDMVMVC